MTTENRFRVTIENGSCRFIDIVANSDAEALTIAQTTDEELFHVVDPDEHWEIRKLGAKENFYPPCSDLDSWESAA